MKRIVGVLAVALAFLASAQEPVQLGDWVFFEKVDPITDENTSFAAAPASDSPSYYEGLFFVRCAPGFDMGVEVFFDADQYLGIDDFYPVVYRIDGGEPQNSRWSISTNGTSVFTPELEIPRIFAALMGASEFVFRVQGYDGPQTYIVPVSGLREVLDALNCYTGAY